MYNVVAEAVSTDGVYVVDAVTYLLEDAVCDLDPDVDDFAYDVIDTVTDIDVTFADLID